MDCNSLFRSDSQIRHTYSLTEKKMFPETTLNMATAVFAEKFYKLQHSTRLFPERLSFTVHLAVCSGF
jgi:hypothetical protein